MQKEYKEFNIQVGKRLQYARENMGYPIRNINGWLE